MSIFKSIAVSLLVSFALPIMVHAQASHSAKERVIERRREIVSRVLEIRRLGQEFREAAISKDNARAEELMAKFKASYASLPEKLKNAIEDKNPGTRERIEGLSMDDVDEIPVDETAAGASPDNPEKLSAIAQDRGLKMQTAVSNADGSKTATHEGTMTKKGEGEWENKGTTTGPGGRTWTNEGTTTRDGNTVTHEGEVKNDKGEVLQTREGTYAKDGNTVSYDKTITTKDGKTIESEGTITKDGNTYTKEGTTTGLGGKTYETKGTVTKEGTTYTGHSVTTNENGDTVIARDGVSKKEGNTRTTDVETKFKNGGEIDRKTTSTREGKNVNRDTQVAVKKGGGVKYGGDFDILGNGFKAKPKAGAKKSGAQDGGRK